MDETEVGFYAEYSGVVEDMVGVETGSFFTMLEHAERIINSTYFSGEKWVKGRPR